MAGFSSFTLTAPRPLPVIILADVSGSMEEHGKIQALNTALRDMLSALAGEDDLRSQIQVAVITFGGGGASLALPLAVPGAHVWADVRADGGTPMGAAFDKARLMIEDKSIIPGRAYRPTLVLVTDGQPTDAWKQALDALVGSERAGKAFRLAMGIGPDADDAVLRAFLSDATRRVFAASDARQIGEFFKRVTMSVTSRSRSVDPNLSILPTDDFEF